MALTVDQIQFKCSAFILINFIMQKELSYAIDDTEINPFVVQNAFDKAKQNGKSIQTLAQVFKTMQLLQRYQTNKSDIAAKQTIKNVVNSNFTTYEQQFQNKLAFQIDLAEVFPLNKPGTFGRQLQRKCRVVEKGLMQFQDKKEPKFKELKDFVNVVQVFGDKNNDSKIGWIPQGKAYNFRIVLIDKNDSHKAIYFGTAAKAQSIRIYLSQKYKFQKNIQKTFSFLSGNLKSAYTTSFANKMNQRYKKYGKSKRFSRNLQLQGKPANIKPSQSMGQIKSNQNTIKPSDRRQNTVQNLDIGRNLFIRESNTRTQLGYDSNYINELLQKQEDNQRSSLNPKPSHTFNFGNIIKAEQNFKKDMLRQWLASAKLHAKSNDDKFNKNASRQDFLRNKQPSSKNISASNRQSERQLGKPSQLGKASQRQLGKASSKKMEQSARDSQKGSTVEFLSIQFLSLSDLYFKPIITIDLVENGKIEKTCLYNTQLKKKDPNLHYYLLSNSDESIVFLKHELKRYEIGVKVIDFLANEEVLVDQITLKTKIISEEKCLLLSQNKEIRLEIRNQKAKQEDEDGRQEEREVITNELLLPPLNEKIREKINTYWEKESNSRGYYNESNLSLYEKLNQSEEYPKTWMVGLTEEEYNLLNIVNTASAIMGFRMVKSFAHILKVFVKLFSEYSDLIEALLSMISHYLRPLYYPEEINKLQRVHRLLGLQEDCDFSSKVSLEIAAMMKITEFECPVLTDKLRRKNISIGHQLYEYIYDLFSRNFTAQAIVDIWNFLFKEPQLVQLHCLLIAIAIVKHEQEELTKCKRLRDIKEQLENQSIKNSQAVLKEVLTLKEKYFGESRGILDQIKKIFIQKPLEGILFEFYRKETLRIDERKQNRELQKRTILKKVNKLIDISLPEYPMRRYCLHIYFYELPHQSGSLYFKCDGVEYECLSYQSQKYFIISEVGTSVSLQFVDKKANEYTSELLFNQGINEFTTFLSSKQHGEGLKVSYIAALLTDNQIEVFKKGKLFDHFIAPFIKKQSTFEEMHRRVAETQFLRQYDNNSGQDDLVKKIKVLFGIGSKAFNEIEFYLRQIQTSSVSLQEKLQYVKLYSASLSRQYFLCENNILEKHLLKYFIELMGYNLTNREFECYYKDSLCFELDAPKVLKSRFYPVKDHSKEIKLEAYINEYLNNKSTAYLESDISIDDLLEVIKAGLEESLGTLTDGDLRLLFSSNGEVIEKILPVKCKNKNKEIYFDLGAQRDTPPELEGSNPQILMTEILPSFTKISTILDFVNSNRQVDLKTKYQDKHNQKKLAENINILKFCKEKFNKVIKLRYKTYPIAITVPFLHYFYDLSCDITLPQAKNIFINNIKASIKSICIARAPLRFSENPKIEEHAFEERLGLYGNLWKISKDSKACFFFTAPKEEHESKKKEEAKVFVNFGYGVFRWEPCFVLGYSYKIKARPNKPKSKLNSQIKEKLEFVISHNSKIINVRQYELKLKPNALNRLKQIKEPESISNTAKSNKIIGESLKSFIK